MLKNLKELSINDISLYGGKAANLGQLIKFGINAPNGFVISLDVDIENNIDKIFHLFDTLNTNEVSVRSSANMEDSTNLSFAGQFNTYLHVTKDNLIESIKKCRESSASERVVAYSNSQDVDNSNLKVAVIVQKMIQSDTAGVGFSVNPITNNMHECIIEAVKGVGEALVSGHVTPDTYIIEKKDLEVKNKNLSENEQILLDKELIEVAKELIKIETHYGYPIDIEWAYENNELFILQARPITTISK